MDFIKMDPAQIELVVARFHKHIMGRSTYDVQIGLWAVSKFYQKSLRFQDLEALDLVLNEQFRNLKFPPLPSKSLIQINKEQQRLEYLQQLLNDVLEYSQQEPTLKRQLLNFLYNFLFKGEIQSIQGMSQPSKHEPQLLEINHFAKSLSQVHILETHEFKAYQEDVVAAPRSKSEAIRKFDTAYSINQASLLEEAFLAQWKHHESQKCDQVKGLTPPVVGYVWARLPLQRKWERLYVRVTPSQISFCQDISQEKFRTKYIYINCQTIVIQLPIDARELHERQRVTGVQYDVFQISHMYDSDSLLLSFEQGRDTSGLAILFKQLVMKSLDPASHIVQALNDTNKQSFGKILVRINTITNFFCAHTFFIRITTGPYTVETRHITFDSARYEIRKSELQQRQYDISSLFSYMINQDFYIPITNKYGHVQIEILTKHLKGLLGFGNTEETLVYTAQISLMTLTSDRPLQESQSFQLTPKVLEMIADSTTKKDFNNKPTTLKFDIHDVTSIKQSFSTNPNKMSEDREKLLEPEISDLTLLIDRLPLLFAHFDRLDELMHTFIFFKYPRLSLFWCCLLITFTATFDPTYILSYLFALLACVFGLGRPQIAKQLDPYLRTAFFDHPNKYYKTDLRVFTISQLGLQNAKKQMVAKYTPTDKAMKGIKEGIMKRINKKAKEEDSEIEQLLESEADGVNIENYSKLKEKIGVLESFRKLRKMIGSVNYEVGWYFDLVEKIFKMFSYTNPSTSDLFLGIFILLFLVVSFIPIRIFVILGIIDKFQTESKFYKRRYISNYECSIIAIRNFFYLHKCYDFEELFSVNQWRGHAWPQNFKPDELRLHLQQRLDIIIPDNYQSVFATPMSLCREIGYVNLVMELEQEEPLNEWDIIHNKRIYYKSKVPGTQLRDYILNTIASEIYSIENKMTSSPYAFI